MLGKYANRYSAPSYDDIPGLVWTLSWGIIGENVPGRRAAQPERPGPRATSPLGSCTSARALLVGGEIAETWNGPALADRKRIATSYPHLLTGATWSKYLFKSCLNGSRGKWPRRAYGPICDLVSTAWRTEERPVEVEVLRSHSLVFISAT